MNEVDNYHLNDAGAVSTEEIQNFCADLQTKIIAEYTAEGYTYPGWDAITVEYTEGGRFFRVTRNEPGSKFIFCLVEKCNGNIYKPTSFKGGPAPRVRGNIRLPYWNVCLSRSGAMNLR